MVPISILYEDDAVLVIDKPVGLVVHADGRTAHETLADWVVSRYPAMSSVGEPLTLSSGETIERPGIVHRLDKDTSGVMILAKTQEVFEFLKKQFQDREAQKTYSVFVYGEMKTEKGVIDRPIGRSASDFRKRSAQRFAKGTMRDAVTTYKVIVRGKGCTLVEVSPKTGRMHQIRVHFKAINHPVVHDALYAENRVGALGFTRLALHARSLEITLPSGERKIFEAPLPEDFRRAEAQLRAS
jgi:23S rRNA pseudouridine1911/1915/1917 synthase